MSNAPQAKCLEKQRHVLLIQRGDEDYGVASSVTDFALALSRCNQHVKIICICEGFLSGKLNDAKLDVDVLGIKPPPRVVSGNPLHRAASIMESKAAQKNIAEHVIERYKGTSIDVVQSMNYLLLESCGLIAKAFEAVGVWRMPSGVQTAKHKKIKQLMMSRTCNRHGLISMANSDFTRQSIARNSPLSVVVHHGIDPLRFNPDTVVSATREDFGIGQTDIVFGIFAHIHPNGEKGQHIAVQALIAYLQGREDLDSQLHLMIFGDPTDSDYVTSMREAADRSARLNLHFPGAVSDVETYYGLMDVSLSPRISPEPFGLSVIESMMMGVPVLAHALGGPAETVVDNHTGWLVSASNVPLWTEAFERVISDRPRWAEFSAQARRHALENFTIEVEVVRWAEQLDSLAVNR